MSALAPLFSRARMSALRRYVADPSTTPQQRAGLLLWLHNLKRANDNAVPYIKGLFPQQLAFVNDTAKKKAAVCSRRAGKTEAVAAWLLEGGEKVPGGLSLYIARTRNNARMILWNTLLRINRRHKIGLAFRVLDGQLIVELPNGHRIWLSGCKDESAIDKFRGVGGETIAGFTRVAIDEAQAFPAWLRTLVDDVLEPALLDQDGEIALIGTPGPVLGGLFYTATTGDGGPQWSTHQWTVLDNPFIPHAPKWLRDKKAANDWPDDHPTYVREWLGRWVQDGDALVYPYDSGRNAFYRLPEVPAGERGYQYVLGIDLGFEDSTAFVLCAYRHGHPEVYVLSVQKFEHLIPSAVAARVERYRHEHPGLVVVADTGGLGKGYVEEANQRWNLNILAAQKNHKMAYVDVVRGAMLSGNVKIHPGNASELLDEMTLLQFTDDRSKIDERFVDHACDGFLYAVRECRSHYRPKREAPTEGTEEWHAEQREKERAEASRRVQARLDAAKGKRRRRRRRRAA